MFSKSMVLLVGVGVICTVAGQGTDPVVAFLLDLAGFGHPGSGSRGGRCPSITINPSSRLFYVENIGNDFTPGKPRHLRSISEHHKVKPQRHLPWKLSTVTSANFQLPTVLRHLVARRAIDVRPVTVDRYLDAYVYDSPTDGAGGHRCGNFCRHDESCGFRRKCCRTPCGYACYNAIYNVTANSKP